MTKKNKPIYRIPTMREIKKIAWNGFKAISTFSGCGGSSLGYKMAGFRVLWANEFIPAAQETYRANHPDTILNTQDIRTVSPDQILNEAGIEKGELDLFDGSPPCASFSTAGKREKYWGEVKKYSDTKQRVDDLFFEYARILKGLQPKVFVAENVSGLVKGTAKGYFLEILAELKSCGYYVEAKLLDAKWLGVPQSRQRIIFVGVRNDLHKKGITPAFPKPFKYWYSVKEVMPWILKQRFAQGFGDEIYKDAGILPSSTIGTAPSFGNNKNSGGGKVIVSISEQTAYGERDYTDKAAPTIRAAGKGQLFVKFTEDTGGIMSKGDITNQPSPSVRANGVGHLYVEHQTGFKKGRSTSLNQPADTVMDNGIGGGNSFQSQISNGYEKRKFTIDELKVICLFPKDFIITGTYAQQWERLGRAVPPLMMKRIAETIRDEVLKRIAGRIKAAEI